MNHRTARSARHARVAARGCRRREQRACLHASRVLPGGSVERAGNPPLIASLTAKTQPMRKLPQRVLDDQLRRYSGIGSRLYDLYKIFFGTNYFDDLRTQGFAEVADLLLDIHKRRNEFSH